MDQVGWLVAEATQIAVSKTGLTSRTYILMAVIFATLGVASVTSIMLQRGERWTIESAALKRFNHRLRIWWIMFAILAFGFLLHRLGVVFLFGLVSFWALREFITMTPTRRGDHRTLFWVFFIFTPLQYILIGLGNSPPQWLAQGRIIDFYGFYSIMIPVYASLFIPARIAISGDNKRFLERSAKIQAGLLICVYMLSYAPALLDLELQTSNRMAWNGSPVTVLLFMILIAQLADVFQNAWSRLAGKNVIAKDINASRTWEGVLGSMITTGLCGMALSWATPFSWWEAGVMSMVVSIMAFAGGMTLSAIKRDRGVKDTGTLVQGHAGLLDRIDNVCFAAPVFYHLTRFYFSAE